MIRTTNKEVQTLIGYATTKGWEVTRTGSHLKFFNPQGRFVIVPSTPSDWRSFRNAIAELRRAGLEVPRKNSRVKNTTGVDKYMVKLDERWTAVGAESVPPRMPHVEAILGQWRTESWFDEEGQPLSEDQWPGQDDLWLTQVLMGVLGDSGDTPPPPRKMRIWLDAIRFWLPIHQGASGETVPGEVPEVCSCGRDFRISEWGPQMLGVHIVERHEVGDYDHEPTSDFLSYWVNPDDVSSVLADGADVEIERLENIVEAHRAEVIRWKNRVTYMKELLQKALEV